MVVADLAESTRQTVHASTVRVGLSAVRDAVPTGAGFGTDPAAIDRLFSVVFLPIQALRHAALQIDAGAALAIAAAVATLSPFAALARPAPAIDVRLVVAELLVVAVGLHADPADAEVARAIGVPVAPLPYQALRAGLPAAVDVRLSFVRLVVRAVRGAADPARTAIVRAVAVVSTAKAHVTLFAVSAATILVGFHAVLDAVLAISYRIEGVLGQGARNREVNRGGQENEDE
jgi:hypothetical protein